VLGDVQPPADVLRVDTTHNPRLEYFTRSARVQRSLVGSHQFRVQLLWQRFEGPPVYGGSALKVSQLQVHACPLDPQLHASRVLSERRLVQSSELGRDGLHAVRSGGGRASRLLLAHKRSVHAGWRRRHTEQCVSERPAPSKRQRAHQPIRHAHFEVIAMPLQRI